MKRKCETADAFLEVDSGCNGGRGISVIEI